MVINKLLFKEQLKSVCGTAVYKIHHDKFLESFHVLGCNDWIPLDIPNEVLFAVTENRSPT